MVGQFNRESLGRPSRSVGAMIRPAILSVGALIGAGTAASAQGPMMATHNGSLMEILPAPGGGLVVQYARPRPDLNGLVMPGTVLVRGRWQGRPPQLFVGEAFVFSRLCGAIPFPVRGTVDQSQVLTLFGGAPQFDTSCRILGYDLNSQHGTLRFDPIKPPPTVAAPPIAQAPAASGPPATPPIAQAPINPAIVSPPAPPKTPAELLRDTRRKADKGDPIAQVELGNMYADGVGIPKNDAEAAIWFRRAAEHGNADAQYTLALRYDNGQGVETDGSQALDWYQKSAAQGNHAARNRLDEAALIIQLCRSTGSRIQDELMIISNAEAQRQVQEVAARLATARDTMPLADLHALRVEAMTVVEVLDNAKEFMRVSGIASSRIAAIETELEQITSDGPIVLQIQDAIKSVKAEQTSSNLNSLQDAFAKLNKLYDINRSELKRSKFLVH
jgi:Sel1 repeat